MSTRTTTVRHGTGERFDLAAGQTIRIATPDGAQGGDLSFPGFDQATTRNVLGFRRFGRPWLVFDAQPGDVLLDGHGREVLRLLAYEADGMADIMYPGCWTGVYADRRPGCQDLISAALGLERAELSGMLSFFISAEADSTQYRGLGPVELSPGDHLTFEALVDTPVGVSACPDTGIEGWRAGDLEVVVEGG